MIKKYLEEHNETIELVYFSTISVVLIQATIDKTKKRCARK
jgi:hypothetical protein